MTPEDIKEYRDTKLEELNKKFPRAKMQAEFTKGFYVLESEIRKLKQINS